MDKDRWKVMTAAHLTIKSKSIVSLRIKTSMLNICFTKLKYAHIFNELTLFFCGVHVYMLLNL